MGNRRNPIRISSHLLQARDRASVAWLPRERAPRAAAPYAGVSRPEDNVVGVGVGEKIAAGRPTGRPAIRLYVERKLVRSAVPAAHVLPSEIEGFPTDVIETGRFTARPARGPARLDPRARLRPARPGCSVGFRYPGDPDLLMAGTLGALVRDDGHFCLLSNNHVLADENRLPEGSPIFQPGLLDGGDPAKDRIAELHRFVPLAPGKMNRVDAAIARVTGPALASPEFLPPIGRLRSATPIEPAAGMEVLKVGRTTGTTRGEVFDLHADVRVQYDLGVLFFEDQVLVRGTRGSFSDAGDSGSGIVDRKTGRLAALLFAGSRVYTIVTRMSVVLRELGVTLVAAPVRARRPAAAAV